MAAALDSVDVPVALLGYGSVGAAVHRLLEDGADDIERATGHRLRVVRALVRDPGRRRDSAEDGGCAHDGLRCDPRRPGDRRGRGGHGRDRADGGLRAGSPACPQARRLGEQAARRAAWGRALRGCIGGGRSASLRGVGLRGDPRRSRSCARRSSSRTCIACSGSSTARPTSSSRRWSAGRRLPTHSPRHSDSATRRPTRRTTSRAPTPRRRWRFSPPLPSAHGSGSSR